jgi:nitrite reductase (cytochrome c-552)
MAIAIPRRLRCRISKNRSESGLGALAFLMPIACIVIAISFARSQPIVSIRTRNCIASAAMTVSVTDPADESEFTMKPKLLYVSLVVLAAVAIVAVMLLFENIANRKDEAKQIVFRLVDLNEETMDPAEWGKNFPRQYDSYKRTSERTGTKYGGGGSDSLASEKLALDPRLKTIFAGYAFSVDYRLRRGHAYMLTDQRETKRVQLPFRQTGACLQCHASNTVAYRRIGLENGAAGTLQDSLTSEKGYAQLFGGFVKMGALPYDHATKLVKFPMACADCHDPKSMQLRVTRPGFLNGIRALAASSAPVPFIQTIEKWRAGDRSTPYDPNMDATRQEMRSMVCAQCHVEYYCGPKTPLFYPWNDGLKVEQIESYYDRYRFPDGHRFFDWKHADSGAEMLKAQHPEFEMWSQGMHARSGVACADCHMPYRREGAVKISDHWVRSPMLNVANSCQVCHHFSEEEIKARVDDIQDRNHSLLVRAEDSTVDLINALTAAQKAGLSDDALKAARELQRKAQWRVDFINAENSMGFHAPQEAARILGEAIDFARQGQIDLTRRK